MKSFHLPALFILGFTAAALAQNPADGVDNHTIPPDLAQLLSDYAPKEKALDDQLAKLLEPAGKTYTGVVDGLIAKASGDDEKTKPLEKELTRFSKSGVNSTPDDALPPSLKTAWKNYLAEVQKITTAFSGKRLSLRVQYLKELAEIEKGWTEKNDKVAIDAVRRARACVNIRTAIEAGRYACTESNPRPGQFTNLATEGGYVIGFRSKPGNWAGTPVLDLAQPIYQNAAGTRDGHPFGRGPAADTVVAKEGYAVGAITVCDRSPAQNVIVVGCFQVTFMKINPDGLSLNPKDSYASDWFGTVRDDRPKEHSGNGRMIVGVRSKFGDVTDTLSLLFLK